MKSQCAQQQWGQRLRFSPVSMVAKIEASWCKVHQPLHHNTLFGIPDRVACCLHYLTHSDGYKSTDTLLGISTTRVRVYCRQFIEILVSCHLSSTVCLPKTHHEWATTRNDFEKIAGIYSKYCEIVLDIICYLMLVHK